MKILVASDIHGSAHAAKLLLGRLDAERADILLLLGDLYYHGPRNPLPAGYLPIEVAELLGGVADRVIAVKGNCDSAVDGMVSRFPIESGAHIVLGRRRYFATHGDVWSNENLPPLPKGSVLLFGHTHTSGLWEKEGVFAANPGSVSLPKNGTPAGYLTVTENALNWKTLSGEVYKSKVFTD